MGKIKDAFTPWMRVCDYEDDFAYRQRERIDARPVERQVEEQEQEKMLEFCIKYTNKWDGPGSYGVSFRPQESIFAQLEKLARHWQDATFFWRVKSEYGFREVQIFGDLQWTEMEL